MIWPSMRAERGRFRCIAVALLASCAPLAAPALTAGRSAAAPAGKRVGHPRCLVRGVAKPLDRVWRPNIRSGIGYKHHRRGDIAFAVRTNHAFYGYRPDYDEQSASVVKAMLMVAYLDRRSVADRALNDYDKSLLSPMITRSDNSAADTVDTIVGGSGLQALAARVGMSHFAAAEPIWGETQITARDQTKFFLHIDRYIVRRHRAYAMHLLASIVPYERWGIGEIAPKGWRLYFKGGWGYGTGLVDHQVILLVRGCARVSVAVLTMYDGSHAYGKATLRGMFTRLLKGLPTGRHSRYHQASRRPRCRRPTGATRLRRSRVRPGCAGGYPRGTG